MWGTTGVRLFPDQNSKNLLSKLRRMTTTTIQAWIQARNETKILFHSLSLSLSLSLIRSLFLSFVLFLSLSLYLICSLSLSLTIDIFLLYDGNLFFSCFVSCWTMHMQPVKYWSAQRKVMGSIPLVVINLINPMPFEKRPKDLKTLHWVYLLCNF